MEEDNSIVEKILLDIEDIVNRRIITEFELIPQYENNRNKSPVVQNATTLGLEMWCVRYICEYTHRYLGRIKRTVNEDTSKSELETLSRVTLAGVLLQPEVTTFWNIRRDLVNVKFLQWHDEFTVSALVLSHKYKSNEAFAYRRWLLTSVNVLGIWEDESLLNMFDTETEVANAAVSRAQNNYHAWTHKMWMLEEATPMSGYYYYGTVVRNEYEWSYNFITTHVSEHSAFYYRQKLMYLLSLARNYLCQYLYTYKKFVVEYFKLTDFDEMLDDLTGGRVSDDQRLACSALISLHVYELFYVLEELNSTFPGHEAIWYHRRYVVQQLIDTIVACHEPKRKRRHVRIGEIDAGNTENVLLKPIDELVRRTSHGDDNFIKPTTLEAVRNTMLYKEIVRREKEFVESNKANKREPLTVDLAVRYEKWFVCVLQADPD